jgi:hypothetical protein
VILEVFKTVFSFFFKNNESITSYTMNSIKNACSLNNQGVDLLVSGESTRAREVFQSALSLFKQAEAEAETTSCTEMNIPCDDSSPPFWESTSKVSGLQGLNCFVYDHGVIISDNVNCDTDETRISLYVAIVIFNSALASHSEGAALGQEKALMKASTLYSLVVQLLTRTTILQDTSTTILTMLALNNKAKIHYDQCEYVQSVDCMKNISKIMCTNRGLHSSLNHEDLEGLLLNVLLLSTPSAAKAA